MQISRGCGQGAVAWLHVKGGELQMLAGRLWYSWHQQHTVRFTYCGEWRHRRGVRSNLCHGRTDPAILTTARDGLSGKGGNGEKGPFVPHPARCAWSEAAISHVCCGLRGDATSAESGSSCDQPMDRALLPSHYAIPSAFWHVTASGSLC